jgi:hypothetical protein
MVTHTRVQDGGSWNIEDAVTREGLERLLAAGVPIAECVHDDKGSVDTILSELNIESQKDLWHKTKSLFKKFQKSPQELTRKRSSVISNTTSQESLRNLRKQTLESYLRDNGISFDFPFSRTSSPALVLFSFCGPPLSTILSRYTW